MLFQHYEPVPDPSPHPEKYTLESAEMVGNYALKFVWGDGHGEGLYVWEHLRSLCGCPECSARRANAGMSNGQIAAQSTGQPAGLPTGESTGKSTGLHTGPVATVPAGKAQAHGR